MSDNMLQNILKDHYLYHEEFQHDFLITVRAGGTVYGQYKQALRELYARVNSLKTFITDLDIAKVDIAELEYNLNNNLCSDQFDEQRTVLNLRLQKSKLEEGERNIAETIREAQRFYEQCIYLKAEVGELTHETRKEYEEEMWKYTVMKLANTDYITKGRIGNNALEMALAMPPRMREEVLPMIHNAALLDTFIQEKTAELTSVINDVPALSDMPAFDNPWPQLESNHE